MIFKFIRRHLKGQLRGVREDSSPRRIQPAQLLQTQKIRLKNVTGFPVVSDCILCYFCITQ